MKVMMDLLRQEKWLHLFFLSKVVFEVCKLTMVILGYSIPIVQEGPHVTGEHNKENRVVGHSSDFIFPPKGRKSLVEFLLLPNLRYSDSPQNVFLSGASFPALRFAPEIETSKKLCPLYMVSPATQN